MESKEQHELQIPLELRVMLRYDYKRYLCLPDNENFPTHVQTPLYDAQKPRSSFACLLMVLHGDSTFGFQNFSGTRFLSVDLDNKLVLGNSPENSCKFEIAREHEGRLLLKRSKFELFLNAQKDVNRISLEGSSEKASAWEIILLEIPK